MSESNDRATLDDHGPLASPNETPDVRRGREGESDIPWVPAVVSAVLGALLVSAFVIYALVTRPEIDPVEGSATPTTLTTVATARSNELPTGFVSLTTDIGARAQVVDLDDDSLTVAVATAVAGGADPSAVPPVEIAYWEWESSGQVQRMIAQYEEPGSIGNITVRFPAVTSLDDARLIAYVADGSVRTSVEVDLATTTLPATLRDYRIDVGGGRSIVVDELSIGDGWGWVSWHAEGEFPGALETVVTLVEADGPTAEEIGEITLAAADPRLRRQSPGMGPRPQPYGFTGSTQLVPIGGARSGSGTPESIHVMFTAVMPERIAPAVFLDVEPAG